MDSKEYYVYMLVDPRTDKPFYIGKGKGGRINEHEKEAEKGSFHPKCIVIREIKAAKLNVVKEVVKKFHKESQAYKYEASLIKKIGLENLTNLVPGGCAINPRKPKDRDLQNDRNWVNAVSVLFKKLTHEIKPRFLFNGAWHTLDTKDLFSALDKKIAGLAIKRNDEWVIAEFKKHNVNITFASKVENYAEA